MSDTRAHLQFEEGTAQSYRSLIKQTLETSVFIETEVIGDQLVIYEPEQPGDNEQDDTIVTDGGVERCDYCKTRKPDVYGHDRECPKSRRRIRTDGGEDVDECQGVN